MSKISDFRTKIQLPYEVKRAYAETRINEFIRECGKMNKGCIVSVGGLDSITLYCLIKEMGYDIKGVSISSIEHPTVRAVHKYYGIETVKPLKSKYHILKEFGYPLFSKAISVKMYTLQHPSDKNETYRHAILTGKTGKTASVASSKMVKLSDKYIDLLYNNPIPCNLSDRCCIYMKEKPMHNYCKENNVLPFLGLQATESQRRLVALSNNGCNYFNGDKSRSAPFAIFNKSDVVHLAYDLKVKIPEIYGEIVVENGEYKTTGCSRTGCDICGFGIQFEKTRPHRFDKLYLESPKKWDFWINIMQYGEIFRHIGFKYEQPYIDGESAWMKVNKSSR